MKRLLFIFALLSVFVISINANQPVFTISGNTEVGGVTVSASSTDCNGWTGASIQTLPLWTEYEIEVPQACHTLQVTAFKHGYHFLPDQWSLTFPTVQTDPITHISFQLN